MTLAVAPSAARVPAAAARAVPVVLAAAVVCVQVAFPRVDGDARDLLTMAAVALFFAASATHALAWRGAAWATGLVGVAAGTGLVVEAVGVATGVPFGRYAYTGSLLPQVAGVPWVIPLAWAMMAYPCLVAARRITLRPVPGVLLAAAGLVTWDLFLDPQMVAAGHWVWEGGGPALNGIPLTNHAGWAVTAVVMCGCLWALLPPDSRPVDDRVPLGLFLWTYLGSVVAHAVYLDLPSSAVAGGIGMGVVVAILLRALQRPPPARLSPPSRPSRWR